MHTPTKTSTFSLFLLLLVPLLTALTLALPPPANPQKPPSLPNLAPRPLETLRCTPRPPLYRRDPRPLSSDCEHALLRLPSDKTSRIFRTTLAVDPGYRLPTSSTDGTCTVRISMREGNEHDTASWAGIRYAAQRLVEECKGKGRIKDVWRTGGFRALGMAGKIVLEIGKAGVLGEVGWGGGNSTIGGGRFGLEGVGRVDA